MATTSRQRSGSTGACSSHLFGSENWISRDNWTYTRSLIAENSPYYEAGVKATWQVTRTLAAQLHVINGWQNISETNSDKALGLRLDFTPKEAVNFAYDAFVGNEQPDSLPSLLRFWNEGVMQLNPTASLQLRGTFDIGSQGRSGGGRSWWRGARSEFRILDGKNPLFPDRSRSGLAKTDPVVVTSIALTF